MEGLAASRIGMPVPDALALFNGEFASIQSNPAMDPQKAVYYIGIRNKPDTLKFLRTIFSDQLGAERNEGDTTFVKSLSRWWRASEQQQAWRSGIFIIWP